MTSIRRAAFSRSLPRAAVPYHPRSCILLPLDRTSRSCCNGRIVDVDFVVDAVFRGSDDRCFEGRTTSSTASSASDVARDRRCNSCIVVASDAAAAAAADAADDADSPPEGAYRGTGLIAPTSVAAATVVNGGSSSSMWKLTRWERCGGGVGRIARGGLQSYRETTTPLSLLSSLSSSPSSSLPPPMPQVVPAASLSRRGTSPSSSTARRR